MNQFAVEFHRITKKWLTNHTDWFLLEFLGACLSLLLSFRLRPLRLLRFCHRLRVCLLLVHCLWIFITCWIFAYYCISNNSWHERNKLSLSISQAKRIKKNRQTNPNTVGVRYTSPYVNTWDLKRRSHGVSHCLALFLMRLVWGIFRDSLFLSCLQFESTLQFSKHYLFKSVYCDRFKWVELANLNIESMT